MSAPFDDLAPRYDETFTSSVSGRALRRAVWRRLDLLFAPGSRVLELGCGTGEDACHLARRGVRVVATDGARAMVEIAARKARDAGLDDLVETRVLAIEALADLGDDPPFDGALSNFGAINCVDDLALLGRELAARVRPGGTAALCIMGPWVPWEWLWFALRARPRSAFRRLRPGGLEWRGMTVRYPSPRRMRRALGASWRVRRTSAVGALLPPSYAEPWARRHPRAMASLERWERRVEQIPPLPWLADHYLLELERG